MQQLWNEKNLKSPPITTYKVTINEQDVDIIQLKAILRQTVPFRKQHKKLELSLAHLSRWIYRMKTKFRSDKGLKASERLRSTLLRYLHVNLFQLFETFEDMVPKSYSRVTYLPTLNILQFTLVRIQGVSKLLARMVELSLAAARLIGDRMVSGHIWKSALICYTIAAEVFHIGKVLLNFLCSLYDDLLPFTSVLKNDSFDWLPEGYSFPNDLKAWLGNEWFVETKLPAKPIINVPVDLNSDSEGENGVGEGKNEDIGEVVDIETLVENKDNNVNLEQFAKKLQGEVEDEAKNEKGKKKKKKASVLQPKAVVKKKDKKVTPQQIVDKIKTLKDLIVFENECRRGELSIFNLRDKLKTNMLHNRVKKFIKKTKKASGNHAKVNEVLENAREVIKSLL